MPTSNAEELGLFLKCTVIGRGVFGPCACCPAVLVSDTRKHQDSDVILRGIRTIFGGTDVIFIFNSEKLLFRLIKFQ